MLLNILQHCHENLLFVFQTLEKTEGIEEIHEKSYINLLGKMKLESDKFLSNSVKILFL